jgi:HPt (histidine-containing phosphotransfer) domain-containing protein/anti-sigma regulatory factor (Ser/Thr protein kinase)
MERSPPSAGDRLPWIIRLADRFCPPVTAAETPEERRRARTVVAFGVLGALVIAAFGLMNVKLGNLAAATIQLVCVGIGLFLVAFAMPRGWVRLTAHYAISASILSIAFGIWYGGGIEAPAMVFLPVIPVFGMLSIGRIGGVSGTLQALAVVMIVLALEKLGFHPRHDPPDKLYLKRVLETLAVILQLSFLALIFHNIKERAQQLLARNLDELGGLLDGMRQGVLAFDAHGKVMGRHSRQALEVFRRDRLEGLNVADLLYPDPESFGERQLLEQFIETAFMVPPDEWKALIELAPSAAIVRHGEPDEQHLTFEFRPLFERGRLVRIMLLVADETEQFRLKRAAEEQRQMNEKAMEKVRRMRADGAHVIVAFLETAEQRLADVRHSIDTNVAVMPLREVERLFRVAHTIKGEARVFGFDALSETMHGMEDELSSLRARALAQAGEAKPPSGFLSDAIAAASQHLVLAREELVAVSPTGAAVLDQIPVRRSDVALLHGYVERCHVDPRLAEIASNLASRPFGECTRELLDSVERWCIPYRKRALLEVQGKDESVPPGLHRVLTGCLSHLVRNAVAHGIEPEPRRASLGKAPVGTISIRCERRGGHIVIAVEDDGAGIDCRKVAALAGRTDLTDEAALELIFVDGLSTADSVDALSGRGVGMGAVRADLRSQGYEVRIVSERHKGTRFELFRSSPADAGSPGQG